jgi:hypothetical protein
MNCLGHLTMIVTLASFACPVGTVWRNSVPIDPTAHVERMPPDLDEKVFQSFSCVQ